MSKAKYRQGKQICSVSQFAHISLAVMDGCKNLEESFGEICVRCNKCGRFNEEEREENNG